MYTSPSGQHFIPPPINVYLLKHDYYVMDGHRRVACAKAHNIEYLDAYVTECVGRGDPEAMAGVNFQREFDQETGLHNLIVLSHKYGYRTLLREICACSEGKNLPHTARQWFSRTFCPSLEAIRTSQLPVIYPDILAEDLYVMITDFYYDLLGDIPSVASPESRISGYLFARKIPQKRAYRRLPSRAFLALLRMFGVMQ
jgi:hypothetical protein